MNTKKIAATLALSVSLFAISFTAVSASEGDINLRNVVQTQPHCSARSVYLPGEAQYNILIACRNLIYPASAEALKYVVWITPTNSSTPQRLGELAYGKVFLKTKTPFSSMFVSQEKDSNLKAPTGTVVMRGNVGPIEFLDDGTQPQPSVPEEVLPSPTPAARSNVLSFFRTGAFLTIAAIFVVIIMLVLVKPFK